MTIFKRKRSAGKRSEQWVTLENGTQSTDSHELILMALDRLREKRELVSLVHTGYQSPKTVIVKYDDRMLEIDKPLDWPGTREVIHVLFKDETMVWNEVRVQVTHTTESSIFTEFPSTLFRLQRRSDYRVGVPGGSTVMFTHNNEICQGFQVVDVSANGMFVCTDRYSPLEPGDILLDLAVFFPGTGTGVSAGIYMNIGKAKVMRVTRGNNKKYCYGIFFDLSKGEEEMLLQYVRLRERELLRIVRS
ncbi:MAG: PilZ domain-containing protein [Desulfobulbaceae bacterium]|nr:PilZ domain-containing protein [Desulfobulbaceae bacterium]HIJ90280.1 PilZ domain-containing protein [Deltaproteobacteria bacterium]